MTYQPYPTGGGSNQVSSGERPPQPATVRTAVRLMLAGAGLALLSTIITLVYSSRIKNAVMTAAQKANATNARAGKATLTTAQIHSLANAYVVLLAVGGIVGVLLWLWMAWANNKGSNWARIVASVLFGLNTILLVLVAGRASISVIFFAVGWLVGLVTIVLLWRRDTTAYIGQRVR